MTTALCTLATVGSPDADRQNANYFKAGVILKTAFGAAALAVTSTPWSRA